MSASTFLQHPQIDPVALQLGPLAIHWYGLMYLIAFALFFGLALLRLRHPTYAALGWGRRDIEDLLFLGVIGIIVGGRLGYALFYRPLEFLAEPLRIFAVWEGGLSFHGGFIGVLLGMAWFAWRRQRNWLQITDFIAPCIPVGLASGRIGNFINGELWGRVADPALPWAMVFRGAGDLPRHPSQLYQALLEGLLLFVLLWLYARGPRRLGEVSAAFLVGYGLLRFTAEFWREPDAHLGLLGLGLSMGQWLSLPLVLAGAALWGWAHRQRATAA